MYSWACIYTLSADAFRGQKMMLNSLKLLMYAATNGPIGVVEVELRSSGKTASTHYHRVNSPLFKIQSHKDKGGNISQNITNISILYSEITSLRNEGKLKHSKVKRRLRISIRGIFSDRMEITSNSE